MIHSLTEYLTEETGKNLHLEHLEDQVLNNGVAGARESINFLRSIRDMLAGHSDTRLNITTKWDGAPAIFCGINPENGKFFVGTKGIFNKNAKLNYTNEDIDANHPSEGLNKKLKIALRYLPKLNIEGILQGDMMFSKGDIKTKTIDGVSHITFQPNTIVYAVPEDSKLAQSMLRSQLGIVFHTSYTGSSMEDMKASFNIDIGRLEQTKDVWFRDASLFDITGNATFTEKETVEITGILSEAGRLFRTINPMVLNRISLSSTILTQIKTFNNSKVRAGEEIKNPASHTLDLIRWVETKQNQNVLEAKKEDTKLKRLAEKNEIMRFYRTSASDLRDIFALMNLIVRAKIMIVRKLERIKGVAGTYLRTDEDGLKVTAPEGFVVVDHLGTNAVKLVDRLSFSHANFTAQKNWSK